MGTVETCACPLVFKTTFTTRGTGIMNASEVGQILIRDGNACLPENAEKCLSKSQAAWDWARAEVALLDAMRATGRERPDSPRPGATPHESR